MLCLLALLVAPWGCEQSTYRDARMLTGGEPTRGPDTMHRYGCDGCHEIPGVRGPQGSVGPPLTKMGARAYIAGRLPNTPGNLVRWLQQPQAVEPGSVMPNMGVTDRDARDMAAYLYTLK